MGKLRCPISLMSSPRPISCAPLFHCQTLLPGFVANYAFDLVDFKIRLFRVKGRFGREGGREGLKGNDLG